MLTSTIGNKHGVTLVELMVALVIMVLLSSLVMVAIGPALADARLRTGVRVVLAQLQYARSYAVTKHTETAVLFDKQSRGTSVVTHTLNTDSTDGTTSTTSTDSTDNWQTVATQEGAFRALPAGMVITDITRAATAAAGDTPDTATATNNDETERVTFTALGQGEDVSITLQDAQGKQRIIVVDAMTGRCEVTSEQTEQP